CRDSTAISFKRGMAHSHNVVPCVPKSLPPVMRKRIQARRGRICTRVRNTRGSPRKESGNSIPVSSNSRRIVSVGKETWVVFQNKPDEILRRSFAERLRVARSNTVAIAIPCAFPFRRRLDHLRAQSKYDCPQHRLVGNGTGDKIKSSLRRRVTAICCFGKVGWKCTGAYDNRVAPDRCCSLRARSLHDQCRRDEKEHREKPWHCRFQSIRLRKQITEVVVKQPVLRIVLLAGVFNGFQSASVSPLENGGSQPRCLVQQRLPIKVDAELVVGCKKVVPSWIRGRDRINSHHSSVVGIGEQRLLILRDAIANVEQI